MLRILALASLAVAAAICGPALAKNDLTAFEKQADGLRGYWFSDNGPANLRAVLNVTNLLTSEGSRAKLAGKWGGALAPWRDAREMSAAESNGKLTLELVSAASSKVALALEADGALAGSITVAGGKTYPIRLQRSTLPQIHEWIARNPLPETRAGKDSVVELAYVSASDCPYCRGWEIEYLGGGDAPKPALGWDGLKLTTVKINSFKAAVGADGFPAHLQAPVAQMLKERGWRHLQGTPQFILLVNGKPRVHAFGTQYFSSLIQPALKAALAEKAGATSTN
jgi:hypothetical protein